MKAIKIIPDNFSAIVATAGEQAHPVGLRP